MTWCDCWGLTKLNIRVAAVCVYHPFVETALRR